MKIKGILHAHSTYSYDAKLSLVELKELCKKNNLQFVCMTEHTDELDSDTAKEFVRECEALSDKSFLFIPGFEVPYKSTHVLMIGQREFHTAYAPNLASLKQWTDEAPFVVLAHPVRNKFRVEDGLLEQIDALEVWNQQYEGKQVPRTRSLELYKTLKILKPELIATGGVDLHRIEHMGPPTVTIYVSELDEFNVIEKLKKGDSTVSSSIATFHGALKNVDEVIDKYKVKSFFAVVVINSGKFVNKILAYLGLSLPKWLKRLVRKKI